MTTTGSRSDDARTAGGVDQVVAMAVQVVVSVGLWTVIGTVLDLLLPTGHWLAFAGAAVGVVIALVLVRRGATRRSTDDRAHDGDGHDE